MINKIYRAKLDGAGNPIVGADGDFVMELFEETSANITIISTPNYYGLEQGLFKSSLFTKYIMDYNTKGLLFTQVINNGKRGEDVNEETLLSGLAVMQINFLQSEKDFINQVFADNNFTIRLT